MPDRCIITNDFCWVSIQKLCVKLNYVIAPLIIERIKSGNLFSSVKLKTVTASLCIIGSILDEKMLSLKVDLANVQIQFIACKI